jgi:hypothetical protein
VVCENESSLAKVGCFQSNVPAQSEGVPRENTLFSVLVCTQFCDLTPRAWPAGCHSDPPWFNFIILVWNNKIPRLKNAKRAASNYRCPPVAYPFANARWRRVFYSIFWVFAKAVAGVLWISVALRLVLNLLGFGFYMRLFVGCGFQIKADSISKETFLPQAVTPFFLQWHFILSLFVALL